MATITPTIKELPFPGAGRALLVTWGPMANGDVGAQTDAWDYADRSYQIEGTFGASGAVAMEGSNDGANWHTLTDPQGNSLTFGSAGLKEVTEVTQFIRPHVTNGDGTTALTVTAFLRKTRHQ
jgi:hypothetical protein